MGDVVDDSHSDVGEELPSHLGSSSTNLHIADNLPICNNEVGRSNVASEQLGRGCNKEVGRSIITSELLEKGQRIK